MNPLFFWKNWKLGTELRISGNFIYNGILCFDQMEHFAFEEDIFEFLYNIAVGIERLQKIVIILLESNENIDQDEFEKSLITHSHIELNNRITNQISINLSTPHKKFLSLLSNFYKSVRYERYSITSVYTSNNDQKKFIEFIEGHLNIKISTDNFNCTSNNKKIKKSIGNLIGKIVSQLYDALVNECRKLNIYTYEVRIDSKAFKIFMMKTFNFEDERIVKKEILLYLMNQKFNKTFQNLLADLPPLPLNEFSVNTYIHHLLSSEKKHDVLSEIEELYPEIPNIKERLNLLDILGDSSAYIDDFEEEE